MQFLDFLSFDLDLVTFDLVIDHVIRSEYDVAL